MELRRIIPSDITASAIAHVSLLTLFVLFSEVHPFGAVTAEQIPVEIVTPQELAETADCQPSNRLPKTDCRNRRRTHQPDFSPLDKPAAATAPPAGTACACRAAAEAGCARRAARGSRRHRAVAPPPSQPAAPAYKPPEPDVSIKYQVLLGLPPDLCHAAAALPRRP